MIFNVNPEKFEKYQTVDLPYKAQARKIICDGLGYEPPLKISVLSELILRGALRRLDNQEISQKEVDDNIKFQIKFIKRLMMEGLESYNC